MKLVTEYLERVRQFERLAADETNPKTRKQMQDQAEDYYKLAARRAQQMNVPLPPKPPTASLEG